MRVSLHLFGVMAAAAGTLASTVNAAGGSILEARDYLQPQIDAMTDASNFKNELINQMNIWNGDNWNHLNKICTMQDTFASKLAATAKTFNGMPSLSVEEEDRLQPSANALFYNLLDYAKFMKDNLNKWQRWRDDTNNDKTARTKFDAVKKAADMWMHDFFAAIPKERWDAALNLFKTYDNAFMDARSVYQ